MGTFTYISHFSVEVLKLTISQESCVAPSASDENLISPPPFKAWENISESKHPAVIKTGKSVKLEDPDT